MPKNKNLTRTANGLNRCEMCKQMTEHRHGYFDRTFYRWDRNGKGDRRVVVMDFLLAVAFLAFFITSARTLIG